MAKPYILERATIAKNIREYTKDGRDEHEKAECRDYYIIEDDKTVEEVTEDEDTQDVTDEK